MGILAIDVVGLALLAICASVGARRVDTLLLGGQALTPVVAKVAIALLALCSALPRAAVPVTGLAGLLVAPAVTLATRVMQRALMEALAGVTGPFPIGLVLGLSAIKGVEYATLGGLVAWMERRESGFLASLGAAIPAATVDTFIEARNTGTATVTGTFDSCNFH